MSRGRWITPPKYRRHMGSGQAVVTLGGRDFYLGRHRSKESRGEYRRLLAEWSAAGQPSIWSGPEDRPAQGRASRSGICVGQLALQYLNHAEAYYRKGGAQTSEVGIIKAALRHTVQHYRELPASEFGPLSLRAVRQTMIEEGLARTTINKLVDRVRRMFRWAVENELVDASVFEALRALSGLRTGRSPARDTEPVEPVSEAHVDAILPLVSDQVASMIRLQLLTGMRPGEVCSMRVGDLDMSESPWVYRPRAHKTKHLGRERTVFLGGRSQGLLRPFLSSAGDTYLFSPQAAEKARNRARHLERKTPMSCGNRPGTNRRGSPRKAPGPRYSVSTYRRAIHRACDGAGVPRWSPNQLRHTAATRLRAIYDLDTARAVLGHSTTKMSELYAERDEARSQRVAEQLG